MQGKRKAPEGKETRNWHDIFFSQRGNKGAVQVRQKKNIADECIKKALAILDRFSPKELFSPDDFSAVRVHPHEQLLQRLNFLLDDRRNLLAKLERSEQELAVFKNINADTSRLLEKKIEELSFLRLIAETTSHLAMSHEPFKPILDKVMTIVGADTGFLHVINPETHKFELQMASGINYKYAEEVMSLVTETIGGRAFPLRQMLLISDIWKESLLSTSAIRRWGIRSLALFPLVIEEKNIGMLSLCNQNPEAFEAESEQTMLIVASQVAVALQNFFLYNQVKKTKEYLENLVERAGDAIFALDRRHTVVSWNRGAETIFRRGKNEAISKPIYDIVSTASAARLKKHLISVLDSERIITTEMDVTRGSYGPVQIALTLSPIRGADGCVIGVSGIAKDITERKHVEEELRRLNAIKSQFVSTVSHELRTPLTSIKSYLEILIHEMRELPEDTINRYLRIMNEECDRLSALIRNVLDLQKLEAGKLEVKLEPLLLAEIVRQATDLFNGIAIPNRIELRSEFIVSDNLTWVMADRKRMMQILSNLLSNALKFANTGGHVAVALNRDNDGVHLMVSDNGIGIPAREVGKIFDKFYQVDNSVTRSKGGTGLGLAITKELVELHGARIWVNSEEGKGCTFHVAFPPADQQR